MQRMCARCAAVFRGRWALHVIWCKVDRFYVCRRCWEWECGEGHGKKSGAIGMAMWGMGFALLFFWCFLGIPTLLVVFSGDSPARWLGLAPTLLFVAGWIWTARESRRRSRRHAEAVREGRPVEIGGEAEGRDESMPWRANGVWPFRKRIMAASTLTVFAAALVLLTVQFLLLPSKPSERPVVGFMAGIIIGFLGVMPVWAALETELRPTAMALTERGVHFWYPTPEERRLADGYVGWGEVAFIGIRGSGKSAHRALERKNGVTERPDYLTSANWIALVEEWRRRGPTST